MSTPWEIIDQSRKMLNEAQQARADVSSLLAEVARQREETAGVALWCSLGEHAFGRQDRKRTVFKVETYDEETGAPVTEIHVSCGPCAAKRRGALQPQKAIPAGVDQSEYQRYLEWKAGVAPEPGKETGT
jgi:hypothetical protein